MGVSIKTNRSVVIVSRPAGIEVMRDTFQRSYRGEKKEMNNKFWELTGDDRLIVHGGGGAGAGETRALLLTDDVRRPPIAIHLRPRRPRSYLARTLFFSLPPGLSSQLLSHKLASVRGQTTLQPVHHYSGINRRVGPRLLIVVCITPIRT